MSPPADEAAAACHSQPSRASHLDWVLVFNWQFSWLELMTVPHDALGGGGEGGGGEGGGGEGGGGDGARGQLAGLTKIVALSAHWLRALLGLPTRHSGRTGWAHHEWVALD